MRRNEKSIKDLREFSVLTKSQLNKIKGGAGDGADIFEQIDWT